MKRLALAMAALLVACGGSIEGGSTAAPARVAAPKGVPGVRVVVSPSAPPEVMEAAAEVVHTLSMITGKEFSAPSFSPAGPEPIVIAIGSGILDGGTAVAEGLGAETYRIETHATGKKWTVEVRGGGPVALQYGAYDLCQRLGARYFHPEETHYPRDEAFELPLPIDAYEVPDLMVRGVHHHTRRPIPYSDFLMAGDEAHRPYLDRWLLWLVRNRLNFYEFELLDGLDLGSWTPFISPMIAKAHGYGIAVGVALSVADETERSFRLVTDAANPPVQIAASLDAVLAAPFDHVLLRTDTSVATTPAPAVVLDWIEAARVHLEASHPAVELYVPGSAAPPASVGLAFAVNGFGGLDGAPARELAIAESGKRALLYMPQSTQWRGLDVDVPLALPIVGQARQTDLAVHLEGVDLLGQVVDSTGDAWGAWLWDLASARYAWDRSVTLEAYLSWLHPLLGAYDDALRILADDQRNVLVNTKPGLIAYLTGDRPSDEVPSPFGPSDRPRRPLLRDIVAMDTATFAAWQETDLLALTAMRDRFVKKLQPLGEPKAPSNAEDDTPSDRVHREIDGLLRLYIGRLNLVLATYGAAAKLRETGEEATLALDELVLAVEDAKRDGEKRIRDGESLYRYPKELLFGARPNPTIWPSGYLQRTHDAYYWVRRAEELEALREVLSGKGAGQWAAPPAAIYRATSFVVDAPATPTAKAALEALLPMLLIGVHEWSPGVQSKVDVSLATDRDGNGVPDAGSVVRVSDGANTGPFASQIIAESFRFPFADATETSLGELLMAPADLIVEPKYESGQLAGLTSAVLAGTMDGEKLRALLLALADGAWDEATTAAIATQVFGATSFKVKLTLGVFEKVK